jgi:hypothetical protein
LGRDSWHPAALRPAPSPDVVVARHNAHDPICNQDAVGPAGMDQDTMNVVVADLRIDPQDLEGLSEIR